MAKKSRVEKTRNNFSLTESQYWGLIRSALRQKFRFWKPAALALSLASRPYRGENKLQKKEYQCNFCKDWFPRKSVEIDHVESAGTLRCGDDLKGFIERLTPENVDAFQVLCKDCHKQKTINSRIK